MFCISVYRTPLCIVMLMVTLYLHAINNAELRQGIFGEPSTVIWSDLSLLWKQTRAEGVTLMNLSMKTEVVLTTPLWPLCVFMCVLMGTDAAVCMWLCCLCFLSPGACLEWVQDEQHICDSGWSVGGSRGPPAGGGGLVPAAGLCRGFGGRLLQGYEVEENFLFPICESLWDVNITFIITAVKWCDLFVQVWTVCLIS